MSEFLSKECNANDYYTAYGIGVQIRDRSIEQIIKIFELMVKDGIKVDICHFKEFSDYFIDGWNTLSDKIGDRKTESEIKKATFVGYLLYVDMNLFDIYRNKE